MGMSYALLAKLPAQYGLYVGLFYPLIYMILGTGIHVNVGVSAIEDLLAGEAVSRIIGEKDILSQLELQKKAFDDLKLNESGALQGGGDAALQDQRNLLWNEIKMQEALLLQNRIDISIGLCVCVGIVYVIMRIVQAGLLADLLSVPVLSGFSTASAFLIGTSQLRHLTGLIVPPDVENADFKILRYGGRQRWSGGETTERISSLTRQPVRHSSSNSFLGKSTYVYVHIHVYTKQGCSNTCVSTLCLAAPCR